MRNRVKSRINIKITELILILLVAISGVFLGISTGGFIVNFNKVGFTIVSSLQKGISFITNGFIDGVQSIKDTAKLKKEYEELTIKLADYEFVKRNNTEINKENERLRQQLDFVESIQQKKYPAQIIARDADGLYSGITVNKGTRNGIKKGMSVIAIQDGNVGIVGKIVTVGIGTSMIMPIYDISCNISSRIQNTRDLGIVTGNGSSDAPLSMKYIKKRVLDELNKGDIVVTSGENDNYMRDVPVGTISQITVLDYNTSLDIQLQPMIDFSRLETVIIVDQKQE